MSEPLAGRHAAAAESIEDGVTGLALPEPTVLGQYAEILPGFARQVLDAAREEVEHRRRLERAESQRQRLGQVFALIVALSFLVAGFALVSEGHDVAGTVLGTADLVALVTAFLLGRANR